MNETTANLIITILGILLCGETVAIARHLWKKARSRRDNMQQQLAEIQAMLQERNTKETKDEPK